MDNNMTQPVTDRAPDRTDQKHPWTSKRVTDHLANERTFLAWVRTSIAIMAFGFVVARFGLLLRELGMRNIPSSGLSLHISSPVGIALVVIGVVMMLFAFANYKQIRTSIDREQFHPQIRYSFILTGLTVLVGLLLAFYLWLSA